MRAGMGGAYCVVAILWNMEDQMSSGTSDGGVFVILVGQFLGFMVPDICRYGTLGGRVLPSGDG